MEFRDVLANSESMDGKWESGNPPPKGDFRTAMEAIQKVLPDGVEEVMSNTYTKVFWGLAQAYYKQASDGSSLQLTSQRVYQSGGWTDIVRAQWDGYAFGSDQGLDVDESKSIDFKDLAGATHQDKEMQRITKTLASLELPRYSSSGVLLLLLEMLWWGYLCFHSNGDTIGEGDEEFFAYYGATALDTYQYFLEHPEEKPFFKTQLSFEFYPQPIVGLDFGSSQTNNSDTGASDFPFLIDVEFIGYPSDLVSLKGYNPDGGNDAFLLVTVSSKTNAKLRYTLLDVGLNSEEIVEESSWATTPYEQGNFPLGVCTVVKDREGNYIPEKLINSSNGSLALSIQPNAVFGLVLDMGCLTPKIGSSFIRPTTFDCYFRFEGDSYYLETQVTIPLA